jgi:hypothetical protein
MKRIIDCESGEVIERELNKAEKDQQKIDEALIIAEKEKLAADEAAKLAAKQTILDRIGLSVDELKTILG